MVEKITESTIQSRNKSRIKQLKEVWLEPPGSDCGHTIHSIVGRFKSSIQRQCVILIECSDIGMYLLVECNGLVDVFT